MFDRIVCRVNSKTCQKIELLYFPNTSLPIATLYTFRCLFRVFKKWTVFSWTDELKNWIRKWQCFFFQLENHLRNITFLLKNSMTYHVHWRFLKWPHHLSERNGTAQSLFNWAYTVVLCSIVSMGALTVFLLKIYLDDRDKNT